MGRVVGEAVGFADPLWIDELARDDIGGGQGAGIAKRQRPAFDRPANRTPYVDLRKAMAKQTISLLRQMVADAPRRRLQTVVVMHDSGGIARPLLTALGEPRVAHDMIENQHALRAGHLLQQSLDLGIVNRLNLFGIVKIP